MVNETKGAETAATPIRELSNLDQNVAEGVTVARVMLLPAARLVSPCPLRSP